MILYVSSIQLNRRCDFMTESLKKIIKLFLFFYTRYLNHASSVTISTLVLYVLPDFHDLQMRLCNINDINNNDNCE